VRRYATLDSFVAIPPGLRKAGLLSWHRYAMHGQLPIFEIREEIG
jgi:hypothetical protein